MIKTKKEKNILNTGLKPVFSFYASSLDLRQSTDISIVPNTEYRNLFRTRGHAHLPFLFDCRDVIIISGQLWPKKLPKSRSMALVVD